MPKKETANSVKPHTEEKLRFYIGYLERYLPILLRTSAVSKINIYDMYCGAGLYGDGKKGSALLAVDAVWRAISSSFKFGTKPINLLLNDIDDVKVEKLSSMLSDRGSLKHEFEITCRSYEAMELLDKLPKLFEIQDEKVRNLIFIDPYGYKTIQKKSLQDVISNKRTEIILFLPIEQMYRFKDVASKDEVDKSVLPLKNFIDQFEIETSKINSEPDFIKSVEGALSFNERCFATSYQIKNHNGHYYGMFFVTSSLYGLEKIIEVKWRLDEQTGESFSGNAHAQQDFFLLVETQEKLKNMLEGWLLEQPLTNVELYKRVITNGFLPKHANKIFLDWQKSGRLNTIKIETSELARKNSFYLGFKYLKQDPLILFELK